MSTIMKKYTCFEEICDTFGAENIFECEGKVFDLRRVDTYENKGRIKGVHIININHGVKIRVYLKHIMKQYTYYVL